MTKNSEKYEQIKKIFKDAAGIGLHERHGATFSFTMRLTPQMEICDIAVLDLSVRATNGLRRAGYHTVGDLCIDLSNGADLKKIRNCGAKSYSEIMEKLFLFNLANMSEQRQRLFILETIEKNHRM